MKVYRKQNRTVRGGTVYIDCYISVLLFLYFPDKKVSAMMPKEMKRKGEQNLEGFLSIKEAIDNGDIKIITTCTPKGYHKKFDSDPSLANKFQRIDLNAK